MYVNKSVAIKEILGQFHKLRSNYIFFVENFFKEPNRAVFLILLSNNHNSDTLPIVS